MLPVVRLTLSWLQFQFFAVDINIYYNEILFLVLAVEHLCMQFASDAVSHFLQQIQLKQKKREI